MTLKLYNTLRKIAAWGNQGNRMRTANTAFNSGNTATPSNSTVTPSSTRPGYYSARRDLNSPGAQYRAQLDAKVKAMNAQKKVRHAEDARNKEIALSENPGVTADEIEKVYVASGNGPGRVEYRAKQQPEREPGEQEEEENFFAERLKQDKKIRDVEDMTDDDYKQFRKLPQWQQQEIRESIKQRSPYKGGYVSPMTYTGADARPRSSYKIDTSTNNPFYAQLPGIERILPHNFFSRQNPYFMVGDTGTWYKPLTWGARYNPFNPYSID